MHLYAGVKHFTYGYQRGGWQKRLVCSVIFHLITSTTACEFRFICIRKLFKRFINRSNCRYNSSSWIIRAQITLYTFHNHSNSLFQL